LIAWHWTGVPRAHNNRVSIDFYVTHSKYTCVNNRYMKPSSVKSQ
jgi:hypothetical protein